MFHEGAIKETNEIFFDSTNSSLVKLQHPLPPNSEKHEPSVFAFRDPKFTRMTRICGKQRI